MKRTDGDELGLGADMEQHKGGVFGELVQRPQHHRLGPAHRHVHLLAAAGGGGGGG